MGVTLDDLDHVLSKNTAVRNRPGFRAFSNRQNGSMPAATYPPRVLLLTFSGVVNRHQADVIAYLVEDDCLPEDILAPVLEARPQALRACQQRRVELGPALTCQGEDSSFGSAESPSGASLRNAKTHPTMVIASTGTATQHVIAPMMYDASSSLPLPWTPM